MVLYGPLWFPMILYGPLWSSIIPYGPLWSPIWSSMVPNGPIWSHRVLYSPVGSCRTPFVSFGYICLPLFNSRSFCTNTQIALLENTYQLSDPLLLESKYLHHRNIGFKIILCQNFLVKISFWSPQQIHFGANKF